jgi:membrane-associated phospholipid phosphatase
MSPSPLRPSERLTALALACLLALTLLARPAGWALRAGAFAGLLLADLWLGSPRRAAWLRWVRDFVPVVVVLVVFLLLNPLVAALNPRRWDVVLAALDQRQFSQVAALWRGAFGRPAAFTDLAYLAYASFYFLPLTTAVLTRLRLGPERFERMTFTLLLGFYLSFLGYFLWPAEGPRVPQALESAQLGGGVVSGAIRAFLHGAESTTLDAFPSGHTALSLLPALLATRSLPRLAPLLWAWALAIVFATVYISAHYVVDVLAGLVLAGLTLALAAPLARLLGSTGPDQ